MSACFAYGLAAGDPIKALTIRHGTPPLWQGLPVLVVLLLGGFTTNFIWCLTLNIRNKTGYNTLFPKSGEAYPVELKSTSWKRQRTLLPRRWRWLSQSQ